jgi:hydrogenase-1 operon protein HyaF
MKPFPIPVVAEPAFLQEEEPFHVITSPGEMPVFRAPARRSPATPADERAARAALSGFLEGLRRHLQDAEPPPVLDLDALDPGCARVIDETLGEGEVSARVEGVLDVQETAFPGLWRVRELGAGPLGRLEAGPIPAAVRAAARGAVAVEIPPPPPGLMNAPALIPEILDRAARFRRSGETHVINFTLLPMTPEDLSYLDVLLGRGGLSVLSRGYGNCRVTATALDGVWWVQYFNASDALILNTLEITAIPEAVPPEDLADTLERLSDCLEALES